MSYMNWNDKLSVGIAEIDEQHKHLVQLINYLHHYMEEGRGDEAHRFLLTSLLTYVTRHFEDEEALMEANQYPLIDEHKKEHRLLAEKTRLLKQHSDKGENNCRQTARFLKRWLLVHIMRRDGAFGEYLRMRQQLSAT